MSYPLPFLSLTAFAEIPVQIPAGGPLTNNPCVACLLSPLGGVTRSSGRFPCFPPVSMPHKRLKDPSKQPGLYLFPGLDANLYLWPSRKTE